MSYLFHTNQCMRLLNDLHEQIPADFEKRSIGINRPHNARKAENSDIRQQLMTKVVGLSLIQFRRRIEMTYVLQQTEHLILGFSKIQLPISLGLAFYTNLSGVRSSIHYLKLRMKETRMEIKAVANPDHRLLEPYGQGAQ